MSSINSYRIPLDGRHVVQMPRDARLLNVYNRYGYVFVWVLADQRLPLVGRKFLLAASTVGLPSEIWDLPFVGTAEGVVTTHVFDRGEEEESKPSDMRAEFEDWGRKNGWDMSRHPGGGAYQDCSTERAWTVWLHNWQDEANGTVRLLAASSGCDERAAYEEFANQQGWSRSRPTADSEWSYTSNGDMGWAAWQERAKRLPVGKAGTATLGNLRAQSPEEMRAEFEAYMRSQGVNPARNPGRYGSYVETCTQYKWAVWQAARRSEGVGG